eukprot:TRINITY_DN8272_c0_g1_i1.p2 TRINITY_DN8272_c0_g1~~TRINITY_DN8272_c0_g1_i1.p2  ORF type:complete len:185 (-),score=20.01 TRINITY_DN8272_c0_g1_i1:84-638(-)
MVVAPACRREPLRSRGRSRGPLLPTLEILRPCQVVARPLPEVASLSASAADWTRSPREAPQPPQRPLQGPHGSVNPGSQYWDAYHKAGFYDTASLVSSTHSSFAFRPPTAVGAVDARDATDFGHGRGTGHCGNTTALRGVSWMRSDADPLAESGFRTTYGETMRSGFSTPRVVGGGNKSTARDL